MTYNCRLYRNSGFNENNIPDNPDILNSGSISFTDVPALDVMQCRNLSKIRVKCSWKQARNVDYIRLIDDEDEWYYYASNPVMVATDVCEFEVVTDYISSTGGVANLSFLDGTTERVHVADDSKVYSCENDPLLTPSEPMKVETEWAFDNPPSSGQEYVLIEATLDPILTYTFPKAVTYTDSDTNEKVTIATGASPKEPTSYTVGETGHTTNSQIGTTLYVMSGPSAGIQPNANIKEGIARLRSLGLEQSIIRQYKIPAAWVTVSENLDVPGSILRVWQGHLTDVLARIPAVTALRASKNNLLKYSAYQKFGMLTAAGNSAEYNLEDMVVERGFGPMNIGYTIRGEVDPRPDGKPYYRPQTLNGDSSYEGFWRNCIAGMQWKEVPLTFSEASGNAINKQKFENQQNIAAAQRHFDRAMAETTTLIGGVGGVLTAAGGALTGNTTAIMGGIGAVGGSLAAAAREDFTQAQYERKRKSELYDFAINNEVIVPTVNFPFNSEIIRDSIGNGCLCYQYYYTDSDWARIDKLLTMYGYKIAKPLEKTDFTNRTKFNFVACNNVTVTGHAKWINEGIADQLKAGVRVWHVLPNPSAYNDNPIA